MLISFRQKCCQNLFTLIGISIVIVNCCQCVNGSVNIPVTFEDNNNIELLDATISLKNVTTEYSNSSVSEVYVANDGGVGKPLKMEKLIDLETYSMYLNVSEHPGELCNRVCVNDEKRVCYFQFNLEHYQAMGVACGKCAYGVEEDCRNPQCVVGDGVEKGVMSINRQIPGPSIQVCKDDLIIVDVNNHAHGSAASFHWHGLHVKETPYMDGVPFLTQCPIPSGSSFRYQFYATQAGTQFYHSHSGHHKANGQYGALIVRRQEEPLSYLYDYDLPEHLIFLADWMHAYAEQHFPGLPNSSILPDSVVINGRGVYTNPKTKEQTKVHPTIFYVTPGKRYRFRLINSISHVCPLQIQIEKHSLNIIASDSYDVFAHKFDTLVSNAGERYDFILEANHTDGDFWIRVRGLGICALNRIESYALIRYETNAIKTKDELQIPPFPKYEENYPSGTYLNHPNATCWGGENNHCVTELKAYEIDEDLRYAKPDDKFFLAFQNYPVLNKELFKPGEYNHFANLFSNFTIMGAINDISFIFPHYPPLTQPEQIDEDKFCDHFYKPEKCAGQTVCPCIHRLKVKLNSIVELIVVDESKNIGLINHPFHLHGYRFLVTGLGQHPEGLPMNIRRAINMELRSELPRDYSSPSPPFKDTVSIPSRGYAVIRFRATNPGFWLLHCHYEWHLAIGMGLIMQVGETSEMLKPPSDFPQCGNYIPRVKTPTFKRTNHVSTNWYHVSKDSL